MAGQIGKDISILYVEDEEVARKEISSFLKKRAARLETASNGEEGLRLFRSLRPDIVITDIRMPVMDGLAMARAIREEDGDALIVVTTAHSDLVNLLDAIDVGVDQYVIKPVDLQRLEATVAKCAAIVNYRKDRIRQQAEKEKLINELQSALEKVKLLSGFLPICAACKKIRDDRGYWQQIETYIREHSEAEFSHSICPECVKRLYPDYAAPEGREKNR